jgi:hypothetical protein
MQPALGNPAYVDQSKPGASSNHLVLGLDFNAEHFSFYSSGYTLSRSHQFKPGTVDLPAEASAPTDFYQGFTDGSACFYCQLRPRMRGSLHDRARPLMWPPHSFAERGAITSFCSSPLPCSTLERTILDRLHLLPGRMHRAHSALTRGHFSDPTFFIVLLCGRFFAEESLRLLAFARPQQAWRLLL